MAKNILREGNTVMDAIFELSEGNPGAVTVIANMMKIATRVDPQSWTKDLTPIIEFDEWNLAGSRIWMLFKDVCGQNPVAVFTLFRAVQLGFIPRETVLGKVEQHYTITAGHPLDIPGLYKQVKEKLVRFDEENLFEYFAANPVF